MRISYRIDGGFAVFPGLVQPVDIDVDGLPEADAGPLRMLVAGSRFFDRANVASPAASGAADQRSYVVTIEDAGRRRTLEIPETVDDPELRALIGTLDAQRRKAQGR